MWWPGKRRDPGRRSGPVETARADDTGPVLRPQAPPPEPGWSALPPLQRVATRQSTLSGQDTFPATLCTHQDPRFLEPLGHHVVATAPSGRVDGLATSVQRSFIAPPEIGLAIGPAVDPNVGPVVGPPGGHIGGHVPPVAAAASIQPNAEAGAGPHKEPAASASIERHPGPVAQRTDQSRAAPLPAPQVREVPVVEPAAASVGERSPQSPGGALAGPAHATTRPLVSDSAVLEVASAAASTPEPGPGGAAPASARAPASDAGQLAAGVAVQRSAAVFDPLPDPAPNPASDSGPHALDHPDPVTGRPPAVRSEQDPAASAEAMTTRPTLGGGFGEVGPRARVQAGRAGPAPIPAASATPAIAATRAEATTTPGPASGTASGTASGLASEGVTRSGRDPGDSPLQRLAEGLHHTGGADVRPLEMPPGPGPAPPDVARSAVPASGPDPTAVLGASAPAVTGVSAPAPAAAAAPVPTAEGPEPTQGPGEEPGDGMPPGVLPDPVLLWPDAGMGAPGVQRASEVRPLLGASAALGDLPRGSDGGSVPAGAPNAQHAAPSVQRAGAGPGSEPAMATSAVPFEGGHVWEASGGDVMTRDTRDNWDIGASPSLVGWANPANPAQRPHSARSILGGASSEPATPAGVTGLRVQRLTDTPAPLALPVVESDPLPPEAPLYQRNARMNAMGLKTAGSGPSRDGSGAPSGPAAGVVQRRESLPAADHPGFTEVRVQPPTTSTVPSSTVPSSTVPIAAARQDAVPRARPDLTVSRQADAEGASEALAEPSAGAEETGVAPPVATGTATAATTAPGGVEPPNLDELARRLYEPLSARLRAELWLDRERTGRSLVR